jgi:hypothetical protein
VCLSKLRVFCCAVVVAFFSSRPETLKATDDLHLFPFTLRNVTLNLVPSLSSKLEKRLENFKSLFNAAYYRMFFLLVATDDNRKRKKKTS